MIEWPPLSPYLRSGQRRASARGCRSVTLVTDRAVIADAVAKGVFILGPHRGMALIERLPDIEGAIVGAANEVLVSSVSGTGSRYWPRRPTPRSCYFRVAVRPLVPAIPCITLSSTRPMSLTVPLRER